MSSFSSSMPEMSANCDDEKWFDDELRRNDLLGDGENVSLMLVKDKRGPNVPPRVESPRSKDVERNS